MATNQQIIQVVAHVRRRGDRPPSRENGKIWRDKEFLSLINGKFEWESPPSILVTRNPDWS